MRTPYPGVRFETNPYGWARIRKYLQTDVTGIMYRTGFQASLFPEHRLFRCRSSSDDYESRFAVFVPHVAGRLAVGLFLAAGFIPRSRICPSTSRTQGFTESADTSILQNTKFISDIIGNTFPKSRYGSIIPRHNVTCTQVSFRI